jgi:hypothetical protein
VVNGLDPEVVAKGIGRLADEGTAVSGGNLQTALKQLGLVGRRGGGASDDLSGEDYSDGGTKL